jgi:hypothetical protein
LLSRRTDCCAVIEAKAEIEHGRRQAGMLCKVQSCLKIGGRKNLGADTTQGYPDTERNQRLILDDQDQTLSQDGGSHVVPRNARQSAKLPQAGGRFGDWPRCPEPSIASTNAAKW